MSNFIVGLLDKIWKQSSNLDIHATRVHEVQLESISDFQKSYEEQSRSEAEKLRTDVTALVSGHMRRQKDLVEVRLSGLRNAALGNKVVMDEHTFSVECLATNAKRKWEAFSSHAEDSAKDGSNFSAAKHCKLELTLQQCVNTVDAASQQWKKTHASVNEMGSKHVAEMEVLVRDAIESNEKHDAEVASARTAADEDSAKNSKDILQHFDSVMENQRESSAQIMETVGAHSSALQQLHVDHGCCAKEIEKHADETFQHSYMDYEPSGETPVRSEPDLPSKVTIESLRTIPMEELLEEFRENNPYESTKEPRPSLIPRSPFMQLN